MGTCHHCGGDVEFRWMNGSLRPIHVSGGCSAGYASDGLDHTRTRFNDVESYLNPNARCPKCNKQVYFYRSPHNGRVFFDDVGWPWPKHGCFVSQEIRDDQISPTARGTYRFHFRNKAGDSLETWHLEIAPEVYGDGLILNLKGKDKKARLLLFVSKAQLERHGVEVCDIENAPAIVVPKTRIKNNALDFSFLCARVEAVVSVVAHVHIT